MMIFLMMKMRRLFRVLHQKRGEIQESGWRNYLIVSRTEFEGWMFHIKDNKEELSMGFL